MTSYHEIKRAHEKEFAKFPLFFAFDDKQFAVGMSRLGLTPEDTDKIYSLNGTGGFYLRSDSDRLFAMFDQHSREITEAISEDKTGEGFIFDMFRYELANHEYIITGNISDALEAIGLTLERVNGDKALLHGLKKAIRSLGRREKE
ncbi:MAG: DUF7659 family protein [Dethiobacteraceae bacterium]